MVNLAVILALAAAASWAIGMTTAKPGVRYMDPISYTWIRWAIVSVLALTYGLITGSLNVPQWGPLGFAILAGVLDSTFGGLFYLLAMERTTAYQTTTLSSTAPLWGVLGAILLLGEPLVWSTFVAAALVILGAFFLVERRVEGHKRSGWGALFAVLTGLFWGFAETVPAKLALQGGLTPVTLLLAFAVSGGVGMLILMPFLRKRIPRRIERRGWRFVLLSSLGGAFLGWLLWLHALDLAPASVISPVRGATLLFALLYSILFLRERPTRRAAVGMVCVIAGIALVTTLGPG